MPGFLDDIAEGFANKFIAHPSNRPGPAGSILEDNPSLRPGDAQVNLLKGGNVIEQNQASPIILQHELGHTKQNEGKGTLRNVIESLAGFGDAAGRGATVEGLPFIPDVHHGEDGADRERRASFQGTEQLNDPRFDGDPETEELRRKMGQFPQATRDELGTDPGAQGGIATDFLEQLFSGAHTRAGKQFRGTQTFSGIRG